MINEKLDVCVRNLTDKLQIAAGSSSSSTDAAAVDAVDIAESVSFDVVCSAVLGIDPDPALLAAVRSFLARRLDGAIRAAVCCTRLVLTADAAGNHKMNPVAKFVTSWAQR